MEWTQAPVTVSFRHYTAFCSGFGCYALGFHIETLESLGKLVPLANFFKMEKEFSGLGKFTEKTLLNRRKYDIMGCEVSCGRCANDIFSSQAPQQSTRNHLHFLA